LTHCQAVEAAIQNKAKLIKGFWSSCGQSSHSAAGLDCLLEWKKYAFKMHAADGQNLAGHFVLPMTTK